MIRVFFKTIWNNRRRNLLVFIELFMISLVLVNLTVYLVNMGSIMKMKNCYDSENVVTIRLGVKTNEDPGITEKAFSNLKKLLSSNAFVDYVSVTNMATPFNYNISTSGFIRDSARFGLATRYCDIDYDKAMNITPLKGRWFDETDIGKAVKPVIISRDAEEEYFDGNAIGKRLKYDESKYDLDFEIVGVIEPFKRSDIEFPTPCIFFLKDSIRAKDFWDTAIMIRTKDNKTSDMLAIAEQQVYSTLNPENWTIEGLNAMENMRNTQNDQISQGKYIKLVIAIFIIINVFLGTIGILWYNTNLRVHEIGVKRALGSSASGIRKLLIAENMFISIIALLLVVVIMVQLPPIITDGVNIPGVTEKSVLICIVIMSLLVLISTWLPASLASKIKPALALKTE